MALKNIRLRNDLFENILKYISLFTKIILKVLIKKYFF